MPGTKSCLACITVIPLFQTHCVLYQKTFTHTHTHTHTPTHTHTHTHTHIRNTHEHSGDQRGVRIHRRTSISSHGDVCVCVCVGGGGAQHPPRPAFTPRMW